MPKDIKLEITKPALLGEDFGFFTTRYEGLMFWVGSGTPEIDVHSPLFLPREEAIDIGLRVFITILNAL